MDIPKIYPIKLDINGDKPKMVDITIIKYPIDVFINPAPIYFKKTFKFISCPLLNIVRLLEYSLNIFLLHLKTRIVEEKKDNILTL